MGAPGELKHRAPIARIGATTALVVAAISGVFCMVLGVLLVVNQVRVVQLNPLYNEAMLAQRAQIPKDQNNQALRESVRELSLKGRQTFFEMQSKARIYGLLLLGGVAVFLTAAKTWVELRLVLPAPVGPVPKEGTVAERSAARWAVAAGGGLVVVGTLVLVLVSPPPIDLKATVKKPAPKAAAAAPAPAPPPVEAPKPPASAASVPLNAWPGFRGPGGQGRALHANAPLTWNGKTGENIRWKVALPKPGTGSVATWGGKVFAAGADDAARELWCFDADSGKLLWTGVADAPPSLFKVTMEGVTLAPSTPAVDPEQVYAAFATGDVAAFTHDGKKVWSRHLGVPKISYAFSSSPVAHPGRVLLQHDTQDGGRFLALDYRSGKTLWEQKREVEQSWSTPLVVQVGNRPEAVLNAKPYVMAHDPQTGKILWQIKGMDGEVTPSPAFAKGLVIVACDHAQVMAIRPGPTPELVWTWKDDLPDVASPLATDDWVLLASPSGLLTLLETSTGKKLWTKEHDEGFWSSPVLVGDRVYAVDRKGRTLVFKAGAAYEQLALNELGEKTDCSPAIPDGRVYLRTEKHLYCVGKGGP